MMHEESFDSQAFAFELVEKLASAFPSVDEFNHSLAGKILKGDELLTFAPQAAQVRFEVGVMVLQPASPRFYFGGAAQLRPRDDCNLRYVGWYSTDEYTAYVFENSCGGVVEVRYYR